MNNPLFSILIANYNNAQYLQEAIQSIFSQTYKNWEVVIVDDASTDNSEQIILNFLPDKRIKFFKNNKNHGCGFTKQRCFEEASGIICGYLDPDDTIEKDAIKLMVEAHQNNPKSSLVYSNCFYCNETMSNKRQVKNYPLPRGINVLENAWRMRTAGHFATFKRDLFLKTGGISKQLKRAVDQDIYIKCEEVGQLTYIDKDLYNYRIHHSGISTLRNRTKAVAWHLYVVFEACKRRNIEFEPIITQMLENIFLNSKEYRVGKLIISPLRKLFKRNV